MVYRNAPDEFNPELLKPGRALLTRANVTLLFLDDNDVGTKILSPGTLVKIQEINFDEDGYGDIKVQYKDKSFWTEYDHVSSYQDLFSVVG